MQVLINAVGSRTGGSETFLMNLLPRLAEASPDLELVMLVRQDRAHLYAGSQPNLRLWPVPKAHLDTPCKRLLFEHHRIPSYHRRGNFCLHFQDDEMLSPLISQAGIPSLAVFHTTPLVLLGNLTGDGWLMDYYARFIRWHSARYVTIPITVSYYAKAELSGLYPFSRDRFRVVYHGVDQSRFFPGLPDDHPLEAWGIRRPYLLSISNRFVWKNYFRLIQAYHRWQMDGGVGDLVLVGQAKLAQEEERLRSYLKQHDLASRVHLIDYIEQRDLPQVYRGAWAYVFPSLRETFGLTVLEAMACGVPVACARWGPLPEVAGDAAYYFNPFDVEEMATSLAVLANDQVLLAELRRRGLERVRHFTWERAAAEYRSLILEAAGA